MKVLISILAIVGLIAILVIAIPVINDTVKKETEPKTKNIQLSYELENNRLYANRDDAFLWEEPKINIFCNLTNTSEYNGTYSITVNIVSEKAERKKIIIERYIKAGNSIEIKHSENVKRGTFQKINIENFDISPQWITIDRLTGQRID